MSFACECWIENISEHIIKALDNMGRHFDGPPYPWGYWLHDCRYLYCHKDGTYTGGFTKPKYTDYKCDNTVQFLVLSNMRDDTKMMQWFWYNHPYDKKALFQCTSQRQLMWMETYPQWFRKATPEELLERFK